MMLQYIILAFLFCVEIFIISKSPFLRGKSKACVALIFFQFWIFYGFRDPSVLPDTLVYFRDYSRLNAQFTVGSYDSSSRYGIGYQTLEYLFGNDIGLSFMWFVAFAAFVYLLSTLTFFYRYSATTWIAIFFFVMSLDIFSNFIALRQSIALGIGLASFSVLWKRKYFLYTCLILLASTFHTSAIGYLMLIPLMLNNVRFQFKEWIVVVGGMVAFVSYSLVFDQLTELDFYGGHYVTTSEAKGGMTMIGIFNLFRTSILMSLILYLRKLRNIKITKDTAYNQAFFLITILTFAISAFSIRFWIMGRFRLYFDPFLFAYAATLYTREQHRLRARYALKIAFCCIIITSFFLIYVRPDWIGLFPYQFYDR